MIGEKFCLDELYVKNNWDEILELVLKEKPVFMDARKNSIVMLNSQLLLMLLQNYTFHATFIAEENGSITVSLNEIDLYENGCTEYEAKERMINAIIEYAEFFYEDYDMWMSAPNRRIHLPYVLKVLLLQDKSELYECIEWKEEDSDV